MKYVSIRGQAGLSIVELMVALLLSSILIGGVLQVFLSSNRTYATTEALARTQENGRFALEFIAQSARQAGYLEPYLLIDKRLPLAETNCNWPSTADEHCTANGATNDRVTFILQPPLIKDDPSSAAMRRDCAGNEVAEDTIIANVFHIAAADANNPYPSLACTTFTVEEPDDFQTVRLVDGIENLQLLYGISTTGDPQSVNQFVSADRVTDWSKVSAIRVAVLANSMGRAASDANAPVNFILLDTRVNAAADGMTRQVFTTTLRFHNLD
ncbi:PilW family protein [Pseudomonas sp. Q1-7]|uniref:PilW family protein n=1 Tax=Pseudomonas sp. Q1-7 TaxID=3020843 RepID=UPI0023001176|nr:PilW family protein [Pseudomonas sp. Q1-7]